MDRRWWTDLFREEPAARRRLVLLLYTIVGPVFTLVLVDFDVRGKGGLWAPAAVAGLIVAGALWLALRRRPQGIDWVFPAAIVPTVCCGIAAYASGAQGRRTSA